MDIVILVIFVTLVVNITSTYRSVDNKNNKMNQVLYGSNSIIKTNLSNTKEKIISGSDVVAIIKCNRNIQPAKVGIKINNGIIEKIYGYETSTATSYTYYISTDIYDSLYIAWNDKYVESMENVEGNYLIMKYIKK